MGNNRSGHNPKKKKQIQLTEEQFANIEYRPLEVAEFLEVLFLDELGQIIEMHGNAYLKFLLIIQGIEFLGACDDNHPFEMNSELLREKLPRKRFNRGLKFFRKEYHQFTGEGESPSVRFFEDLRNPMVHQFRPNQSKFRLSDQTSLIHQGGLHLSYDHKGRLILVLENFYQDFADAVRSVMRKIETGELNASKLTDPHITIESIRDLIQTS